MAKSVGRLINQISVDRASSPSEGDSEDLVPPDEISEGLATKVSPGKV